MNKEKIAVIVGFLLSWLISTKTINRAVDIGFMGGYFYAGFPISIRLGLMLPTGGQIFWVALANSWIYMLGIWLILASILRKVHK